MNPLDLEGTLASKPYAEVEVGLAGESELVLLSLLDSHSRKVGDCAAELLVQRGQKETVIDAIVRKKICTPVGKIRALSILHNFGKQSPKSVDAFLFLVRDTNKGVIDSALFGLAFFQDKSLIPLLRAAAERFETGSPILEMFDRAVSALEEDDPFIYSPGFHDAGDVWCLDKDKFKSRIG